MSELSKRMMYFKLGASIRTDLISYIGQYNPSSTKLICDGSLISVQIESMDEYKALCNNVWKDFNSSG